MFKATIYGWFMNLLAIAIIMIVVDKPNELWNYLPFCLSNMAISLSYYQDKKIEELEDSINNDKK